MNKLVFQIGILMTMLCIEACSEVKVSPPQHLTVSEDFTNPIGFYDRKPTFSWLLPAEAKKQSAYSISVASDPDLLPENPDLWKSEKTNTSQSIEVQFSGAPIKSRQEVYWQVRYWDEEGSLSDWSNIAHFEMGLLNNSDWSGKWIGYSYEEIDTTQFGTSIFTPQYLRKGLNLDSEIVKARMYVTAKGVFEAQINGEKVGKDILVPGWTSYEDRIETLTYDVTQMLNEGNNTIGFILAPGWHSGRLGYMESMWTKKDHPKILCQLVIEFADGSSTTVVSDNTWKASILGPIRFSEIYDGEIYDAHFEFSGWSKPGFDDDSWTDVEVNNIDSTVALSPKRHHPVRNKHVINPVSVINKSTGQVLFDLGQNMVGVPAVKVPMVKGDTLKISYAEMPQNDSTLYTANYRTAKSNDLFFASRTGWVEYQPKFTFSGFRYIELDGYNTEMAPDETWVKGIVQYSDFEQTGKFKTSHKKLNQLQNNIEWGLRGNFLDIPTDCPQRDERLGWTGDTQVFAATSIYNADVHAFWNSWLQTMRNDQYENGGIPIVIPDVYNRNRVSPGWGDATTIIPWELYFRTGSIDVLRENYDMMKGWVEYLTSISEEFIPRHEATFADWLQPYSQNGNRGDTPYELISAAYYARSIELTSKAAEVLGNKSDYNQLRSLHSSVKEAFESTFFNSNGQIKNQQGTQTGYLLAFAFDLLSEDMSNKAIPHFTQTIKEADIHLRTGFLGTPLLAPVLNKIGRTDLFYEMLFKESYPSWLYSINQGATTLWERWDSYSKESGFGDEGMNSFNHYAYGAVGQWMYELITGIRPLEPGYRKIQISPKPPESLTSAKGEYESPYGKIVSEWKIMNGSFHLDVTIPPNTSARILFPYKPENIVVNGNSASTADYEGVRGMEVTSGRYNFRLKIDKNSESAARYL